MPYIEQIQRDIIDEDISELIDSMKTIPSFNDSKAGILNYIVTCLCAESIGTPKYSKINEIIGMLECCKLELYRRVAAGYEDKKSLENGDAYPPELVGK